MEKITSIQELKQAIYELEEEQTIKGLLLKDQFYLTYESLKPANLIKSTLKDVLSSPSLTEDILGAVIGLAGGFLSKKVVVGASGNLVRKLIGSLIQFGVGNVVAQHPDAIRSIGQFILSLFSRKKEVNTEK